MTVTQRWCPCGFVAVWRRDELSRPRDTSDVLLQCAHDGPGRLIPNTYQRRQGQVRPYALYKLLNVHGQRSPDVEYFMCHTPWHWGADIIWTLHLNLCIQKDICAFFLACCLHPQLRPHGFFGSVQKCSGRMEINCPDFKGSVTVNNFKAYDCNTLAELCSVSRMVSQITVLCFTVDSPLVNVKVFACE